MCAQSLQSCPTPLPRGLWLRSRLCPRDSPGENTGVGSISFSGKGLFPTQVSNLSPLSPVLAGRFFITSATLEAHLRRCLYSIKDTAQSGPYEDVEVVWRWLGVASRSPEVLYKALQVSNAIKFSLFYCFCRNVTGWHYHVWLSSFCF